MTTETVGTDDVETHGRFWLVSAHTVSTTGKYVDALIFMCSQRFCLKVRKSEFKKKIRKEKEKKLTSDRVAKSALGMRGQV